MATDQDGPAQASVLHVLRWLREPRPRRCSRRGRGSTLHFPELQAKQLQEHAKTGEDGRALALARVFPALRERLLAMEEARERIARLWDGVLARAGQEVEVRVVDRLLRALAAAGLGRGRGRTT